MDQPSAAAAASPQLGAAGAADAEAARLLAEVARRPDDWRPLASLSEALLAAAPGRVSLPAPPGPALEPGAALAASIRGIAGRDMGRERAAQRAAREAVRRHPDDPLLLHLLVRGSLAAGRAMDAMRAAARLDEVAPELAISHDARALIALRLRRWRDAEAAARRALAIAPRSASAHQELALALQGQGRQREAVSSLAAAGSAAPATREAPPAILVGIAAEERRILLGLAWLAVVFLLVVQLPQVESLEPLTVVSGGLLALGVLLLLSRIGMRRRRLPPPLRDAYWVAMRRDTPWWPLVLLAATGVGRLAEAAIAALAGGPVLQPAWRLLLVLCVCALVCAASGIALVQRLRAHL